MITSKNQLKYYLQCDKIALGKTYRHPKFVGDERWKFQICMRKLAYYMSRGGVMKYWYRFKYHRFSVKLGFSIPYNVIGPGLAIVHYGTLVISTNARIGKNCRIHAGVNIGANGGEKKAAVIDDNVYIGPGAKIIGEVKIGKNSVIGANSVVIHDVPSCVTVAGVPAKIISENDSSRHLIKASEIIAKENKNERTL